MLAYTRAKNCELVRRPGLGFSELAGTMQALHVRQRRLSPADGLEQGLAQERHGPGHTRPEHPVPRSQATYLKVLEALMRWAAS